MKFKLGKTVATAAILQKVSTEDIHSAIDRHAKGDWGEVSPDDAAANDEGLLSGDRLLSEYTSSTGVKFWIITEGDRSVTTALLPSDY